MSSPAGDRAPHPTKIRIRRAERELAIAFDDGESFLLPAELLRVESPSAEVQNHGGPKTIVPGKRAVGIHGAEPVGHYAIRIRFDDGHDTGIFSWDYLRFLGEEQKRIFAEYLHALESKELSRNP